MIEGFGGRNAFGVRGAPRIGMHGEDATGYGAGGGGCVATTPTHYFGGRGAPGMVQVIEYAVKREKSSTATAIQKIDE